MATAFPDIPPAELRAVVRAVRAHPRRDKDLRAAVAVFAFFLAIFLHSAMPGAWNPSPAHSSAHEENQMLSPRQIAVVSSLALSSAAVAQNAVQWRVEDGGNGHWYQIDATQSGWSAARTRALARGGDLASFEVMAELQWLLPQLPTVTHGYLAGGIQDAASASPDAGWRWLTGSSISPTLMIADDNPCGAFPPNVEDGQQDYLHLHLTDTARPFGDINDGGSCSLLLRSIVEWSADCNADGIVDYGQIRAGELADTNANNIPDCCEGGASCNPCPGDVDGSGAVNGVDLAAVLNNWGTNGGKYPGADTNHDGVVDGVDLAQVLGSWGTCH